MNYAVDGIESQPEIPIAFCPRCRAYSMEVAAMIPCVRLTALTEIRYCCKKCSATDVAIW
jgi:hypothetical protein